MLVCINYTQIKILLKALMVSKQSERDILDVHIEKFHVSIPLFVWYIASYLCSLQKQNLQKNNKNSVVFQFIMSRLCHPEKGNLMLAVGLQPHVPTTCPMSVCLIHVDLCNLKIVASNTLSQNLTLNALIITPTSQKTPQWLSTT